MSTYLEPLWQWILHRMNKGNQFLFNYMCWETGSWWLFTTRHNVRLWILHLHSLRSHLYRGEHHLKVERWVWVWCSCVLSHRDLLSASHTILLFNSILVTARKYHDPEWETWQWWTDITVSHCAPRSASSTHLLSPKTHPSYLWTDIYLWGSQSCGKRFTVKQKWRGFSQSELWLSACDWHLIDSH